MYLIGIEYTLHVQYSKASFISKTDVLDSDNLLDRLLDENEKEGWIGDRTDIAHQYPFASMM